MARRGRKNEKVRNSRRALFLGVNSALLKPAAKEIKRR